MALNADQTAYLNPSAQIPFKSHDDGIARLMRYHIAHEPPPTKNKTVKCKLSECLFMYYPVQAE